MPRVVYLSWPASEVSGGIKVAFQHVSVLCAGGLDAVVASADTARPSWFDSPAPLVTLDDVRPDDVLVFPENHHALLQRFARSPQAKLVFCQNPHYAHLGLVDQPSYEAFGVQHLLCPSQTILRFCQQRFPALPASYLPFYIDHDLFVCPPAKTLQIACVPRKRRIEASFIRDFFRFSHPQFRDVRWFVLDNAPEATVATLLGASAVFLSLPRLEGHSMTTLEAMACGCVVAGFTGNVGGNDSATTRNGFWAAEDDVTACAAQLWQAVAVAVRQDDGYRDMVANAHHTAAAWRREESQRAVVAWWKQFLSQRPAAF